MKFDNNFKPKTSPTDYGWQTRGKLPHLDANQFWQFVTFRLHDSMPQLVLNEWASLALTDAGFRRRVEGFLDSGYGECWLRIPEVAQILVNALKFYDEKKYRLVSWVIMPNHAHVLIEQFDGEHLPTIMHSIKSYSAQQANKFLGRSGQFWQHESFDRYIRNRKHFAAVVNYIEQNPVKAGFCLNAEDWEFSSSYKR